MSTEDAPIILPTHEKDSSAHISINGDDAEGHDSVSATPPRTSSGWDGKLRIEKKTELSNPEAISDPEYSDDENVLPGEIIDADEGLYSFL